MFKSHAKFADPCHLTLEHDRVFRVPEAVHEIEVMSGRAWISEDPS